MYFYLNIFNSRSRWLCGLRRGSAAARLLRLWARISPGAWMFVCCECCVLSCASGRSLVQRSPTECGVSECDVSECSVSECDLETSIIRMSRLTRAVEA
jgi:hypothetical protein